MHTLHKIRINAVKSDRSRRAVVCLQSLCMSEGWGQEEGRHCTVKDIHDVPKCHQVRWYDACNVFTSSPGSASPVVMSSLAIGHWPRLLSLIIVVSSSKYVQLWSNESRCLCQNEFRRSVDRPKHRHTGTHAGTLIRSCVGNHDDPPPGR